MCKKLFNICILKENMEREYLSDYNLETNMFDWDTCENRICIAGKETAEQILTQINKSNNLDRFGNILYCKISEDFRR